MARKKKGAGQNPTEKGEPEAKSPRRTRKTAKSTAAGDLPALRTQAFEAKKALDSAQREAEATVERTRTAVRRVKEDFRKAVAPYRLACRKAGKKCEFSTGRSSNVSTQVSFAVEKTKKGIRVMVKGQPKTEEVIPFATLKESLNRAAYAYSGKHVGPKEVVGNKGGSLSNRLRAVLK